MSGGLVGRLGCLLQLLQLADVPCRLCIAAAVHCCCLCLCVAAARALLLVVGGSAAGTVLAHQLHSTADAAAAEPARCCSLHAFQAQAAHTLTSGSRAYSCTS